MRARAFKKNGNTSNQYQCEGANVQINRELKQTILMRGRALKRNFELKQTLLMCGRAHSTKIGNSIKQCQCAGARILRNRERKQTSSMRGRAHSKTLRIQRNNINVKARAFNLAANSRKQRQCAGARIQQHRELKQIMSMCGRAQTKRELKQTISM